MSHALTQRSALLRLPQAVDGLSVLSDMSPQTVGIKYHDQRQRDSDTECRMIEALADRDQRSDAAHNRAVIARQPAVADVLKSQPPGFNAVDNKLTRTRQQPGRERNDGISPIHNVP